MGLQWLNASSYPTNMAKGQIGFYLPGIKVKETVNLPTPLYVSFCTPLVSMNPPELELIVTMYDKLQTFMSNAIYAC